MKAILVLILATGVAFGQSSSSKSILNKSSISTVSFGGTDNDWVRCIMPNGNGDYILGGESVTGSPNYQLMAATAEVSAGNDAAIWTNIWGTPLTESVEHQTVYNRISNSIFQASYYEYAVGVDSIVSYLVRIDAGTGQIIWKRSLPNNFYALAVWDSGCVLMNSGFNATAQIVNSHGDIVGSFLAINYANGYLKLIVHDDTLWVFTTDFVATFRLPDGKKLWTTNIPGTRLVITRGAVDSSGNAYACFSDAYDLQIGYVKYGSLKLNSAGDILWQNRWFGWPASEMSRNLNNWVNAIAVSAKLHLVAIMGTTNAITSDNNSGAQSGYVAILNSDSGDTLWTEKWDYPGGLNAATNMQDGFFDNDGNLITAGYAKTGDSQMTSFIKKYSFNITPVNEPQPLPTEFQLSQNYPNPFNPTTTISYNLPQRTYVTLKVYNVLGQEVATLADGTQPIGQHQIIFDGSRLASGTYFYVLQAGGNRLIQKMMLMK